MALKRRSHPKHLGNVANINAEEDASTSSDGESGSVNKVRKRLSTERLMREVECRDNDYDHIYSRMSSYEGRKKKRVRKMSEESDHKPSKSRSFSKNAIMARMNRERKKAYISTLENENESLREQNREINKKIDIQNKTVTAMKREILYLKGLLANSKELGQILRSLQNTTSLPVTSSLISNSTDNDLSKFDETENERIFEKGSLIKKPNSLVKYPMIYEDINLGSTFSKSISCSESSNSENFSIEEEFNSLFPELNENYICELEESFPDQKDSSFHSNPGDSDFGICLHVNQKQISVEICSICSNKANLCLNDRKTSNADGT